MDRFFMGKAVELAKQAAALGEVPVGAVIVAHGEVIASGCNRRESDSSALAHAEIIAIDGACRALGDWRLSECTMYVTLEPCPMCAGAIINARIKRVVFGAFDEKGGAAGSVINLFHCPFGHSPALTPGVMEKECALLLKDFFEKIR